jgi:hypothetical protein
MLITKEYYDGLQSYIKKLKEIPDEEISLKAKVAINSIIGYLEALEFL